MPFCPKCGNEVKGENLFCPSCGNRLEDSPVITPIKEHMPQKEKQSHGKISLIILVCVILICIAVGAILFLSSKNKTSFSDDPKAIEHASTSVVLLECYDKNGELYCTGSAFAAFEDGIFVTNYHVVEQEVYRVIAKTEDGTMFEIDSILAFDSQKDIAIIKTKSDSHISPLAIGASDHLEKGEKVVAIGSPLGLLNTVSTGVFSGYNDNGIINEIQFTASISHGSSGGALFNNAGEVIGITYGSFTDAQNLNLAIPFRYVEEIMAESNNEMSISEFYNTFDHYVDVYVDEVLQHRGTIDVPFANLIGIVVDKKLLSCTLVATEAKMQEYLALLPQPADDALESAIKKLENLEKTKDFETQYTITLQDTADGNNIFDPVKIGDVVCVKTSIAPTKNVNARFTIDIDDDKAISILSK